MIFECYWQHMALLALCRRWRMHSWESGWNCSCKLQEQKKEHMWLWIDHSTDRYIIHFTQNPSHPLGAAFVGSFVIHSFFLHALIFFEDLFYSENGLLLLELVSVSCFTCIHLDEHSLKVQKCKNKLHITTNPRIATPTKNRHIPFSNRGKDLSHNVTDFRVATPVFWWPTKSQYQLTSQFFN